MRGISFTDKFKDSCLYKDLYLNHRDELFLAIRNNYLNIYYNCINIAKVSYTQKGQIRCEINQFYLTGVSNSPILSLCSEQEIFEQLVSNYDTIKKFSNRKTNEEKKSQALLFIKNNRNKESKWYCTDVEWCNLKDDEHQDFNARFDIIAVSKETPHRIAIIELKYGRDAVSGSSGLMKHITDFYKFGKYDYFESFKLETISILKNLQETDIDFPQELEQVRLGQFTAQPEFYVITLDNNAHGQQCTPKQTVGGYLFNDSSRWNSPRVSSNTIESVFGDVTNANNDNVFVRFLFSSVTLDELKEMKGIDIIESSLYKQLGKRIERNSQGGTNSHLEIRQTTNYREKEKHRQLTLLQQGADIFYGAHGGGTFNNRHWEFCIKNDESQKNVYKGIVNDCKNYFRSENIVFWGSEGIPNHILSSQVACLNHLFAVRQDKAVTLQLAKMLIGENVIDVEPLKCDKSHSYIAFEVTSSRDYLNEKYVRRGANCTSVDAAMIAVLKDGTRTLIPIEWKYTEGNEYNIDKSGTEGSGKERLRRYSKLIDNSNQLRSIPNGYLNTIYFVEPFYQLMRQTLWAEQIIAHKESEPIKADDFVHVHVIPKENIQLLHRKYRYSEKGLEETWRSHIIDQRKYKWVTPEDIARVVNQSGKYSELVKYLSTRYDYDINKQNDGIC
ncbi:MAG: hypothetical protein IJV38_10460 [Prevotella sp.]|nr:hypothetical protein [Prevotella sp.]